VEPVSYPDLGATVYLDGVPAGVLDELPGLYNSVFSTPDWWDTHDHRQPAGVCVLERPRHVIAFTVDGDTVDVLNKVFAIGAADARRACLALFRALPQARRVRLEVLFAPRELRLPLRVRAVAEHMVVDLPATVADYDASLGKRTRGNLRNFQNRLRRDHPDVTTRISVPGDGAVALFAQFLEWKQAWFHAHGRTTFWEEKPEHIGQVRELARRRGEAHVTTVDGTPVAIRFLFPVGDSTVSFQGSFDPDYEQYRLGLLSSYWSICDAIERGMKQVNLLWGTTDYKSHLGATPRTAAQVSVFRSQVARLYSLGETREIVTRKLRRRGTSLYWGGRGSARRLLERTGVRRRAGRPEA
jgi:CelD/BcsL family acetyltransferase involved in cellulose biosynthesis